MAVQNSLVKQSQNRKVGFAAYLTGDAVKAQINKVVGGKNGTRFMTSIISAVNTNPALQECDNASIVSAALLGETLNLSPSPQLGQFYMVPYNDKNKGKVAQFQLGYKGYVQLALRSGQYKKLNVLAIKEGELIRYDPLDEEIEVRLIEDETEREKAPTIGYYAMFEYLNGFKKTLYWSKEKMLSHADRFSQAFSKDATTVRTRFGEKQKVSFADYEAGNYPQNDAWMYSSFWYKDFDGMAFKTMLRQLISKWGIMSIEMATAIDSDLAVINADGTKDYVESEEYYVESTAADPVPPQDPQEQPAADATKTVMPAATPASGEPAQQSLSWDD